MANKKGQNSTKTKLTNGRKKFLKKLQEAIDGDKQTTPNAEKLHKELSCPDCKLTPNQIKDKVNNTALHGDIKSHLCKIAA